MSSAISTRDADVPRKRLPWRAVLIALLVLGAGGYLAWHVPPVLRDYRDDMRVERLVWAGLIAEEIDARLAENAAADADALGADFAALFTDDPALAYFRVWNAQGALRCELTRAAQIPTATGVLPDLGVRAAWQALSARQTAARREFIGRVQEIMVTQREIGAAMQQAIDAHRAVGSHGGLYTRQDDLLGVTTVLAAQQPLLADAATQMARVLDLLTRNDAVSLQRAAEVSVDIETDLALAMEDYRAAVDVMPALPSTLTILAPPTAGLRRLAPVRGIRVLVPLYAPTGDATLVTPAGAVEVAAYVSTLDEPLALVTDGWPAGAALLLAIMLALPRRRRCRDQVTSPAA